MANLLTKNSVSTIVSVLAAIAAIISALFAYNQNKMVRRQLNLHISPEISIDLNIFEKHGYFQPVLSIRNESPINIISLSSDYYFFHFDKSDKKFSYQGSSLTEEQFFQRHLLYQKKLESNDFCVAELGDVISVKANEFLGSIFIYIIFSNYYRESDMKRFDNKRIFIFENGKIYQHTDFMNHTDYVNILPILNVSRPPDFCSFKNISGDILLDHFKKRKNGKKLENSNQDKEMQQNNTEKRPPKLKGIRMFHTNE